MSCLRFVPEFTRLLLRGALQKARPVTIAPSKSGKSSTSQQNPKSRWFAKSKRLRNMWAKACMKRNDTGSSLPPGLSQKRMLHSSVYRFPEFCSSRCLSHFAAPFLVVWTKTSVAETFEHFVLKYERFWLLHPTAGRECRSLLTPLPLSPQHWWTSKPRASQVEFTTLNLKCKWSFRRFTYGNLVTTSPSSKW